MTAIDPKAVMATSGGVSNGSAGGVASECSAGGARSDLAQRFGSDFGYAPAPETAKVSIKDRYGLFIGGRFVEPRSGSYFETVNPATGRVISSVANGGAADVSAAVEAARGALAGWSGLPGAERGKFLYRIARRLQERAREFAVLETMDGGKPIKESRDVDVPLAAQHFFYHAGWADKLGHVFGGGGRSPRPVGVCGQVIPWNFPLLMAAWKLAPALACGNTCVLKPAETTPMTALRLAEVFEEVGLPAGVVNIVTGDGETGAALVGHADVNKVAFTGSTEVGKKIAAAIAGTGKRLTLELGGKSPHIIFEDASLDQAVEGIVQGIFFNQGHVCCAGSRLLVQESVLDEVIARLTHRLSSVVVGDPLDKNTDLGAINSAEQLGRIEHYLRVGRDEGAELHVCGRLGVGLEKWVGEGATPGAGSKGVDGFWCRPCVFTGVQPAHAVSNEEIFGPVLAVSSFRTPEEAIRRANNSPYGLAAGVWTDKGSKIFEMASRLEAGVVWLNTYNRFAAASPFGGVKQSGFGREGGVHGLRSYLEP